MFDFDSMSPEELQALIGDAKLGMASTKVTTDLFSEKDGKRNKIKSRRRSDVNILGVNNDVDKDAYVNKEYSKAEQQELDNVTGKFEFTKEKKRNKIKDKIKKQREKEYLSASARNNPDNVKNQRKSTNIMRSDLLANIKLLSVVNNIGLKYIINESKKNEFSTILSKSMDMLVNLIEFSKRDFNVDTYNDDLIFATSLFGNLNINLTKCIEMLSPISIKKQDANFIFKLRSVITDLAGVSLRLDGEADKSARKDEIVIWGDLLQRAQGTKEKLIDSSLEREEGGNVSDVRALKKNSVVDGKDSTSKKFFKKDIKAYSSEHKAYVRFISERISDKGLKRALLKIDSADSIILVMSAKLYNSSKTNKEKKSRRKYIVEKIHEIYPDLKISKYDEETLVGIVSDAYAAHFQHSITKAINLRGGADMTKRNFATERMARLMGMQNIVSHNEKLNVVTKDENGENRITEGFTSEDSKGLGLYGLRDLIGKNKGEVYMKPSAAESLVNLQLLDNINGQMDRHVNNIHFVCKANENGVYITEIVGIDNDAAFGEHFKYNDKLVGKTMSVLRRTTDYQEGKSIRNKSGSLPPKYRLNLDVISRSTFDKIKNLSVDDIGSNVAGLVEKDKIEALKARFLLVKYCLAGFGDAGPDEQQSYMQLIQKYYPDAVASGKGKPLKMNAEIRGNDKDFNIIDNAEDWNKKAQKGLLSERNFFNLAYGRSNPLVGRNYASNLMARLGKRITIADVDNLFN